MATLQNHYDMVNPSVYIYRPQTRHLYSPHASWQWITNLSVFLVTEKGYVSESYSESEEEPDPNSQAKDSSSLKQSFGKREEEKKEKSQKKTSTASKPTKQPSIMGFFQKK